MSKFRNAKRLVDYGTLILANAPEKVVIDRDALAAFVRLAKDHPRYGKAARIARQLEQAQ